MAGEVVLPPLVPIARGGTGIVSTPFQFVLTGVENLMVRSANSLPGVAIAIQGRLLQTDGTILPFTFVHTPATNRTIAVQTFGLGPGTLLTVTAFASSGAPTRGQTFIQLNVIQGLSGATLLLGTLLQGYVTSFQQLSWPGSALTNSVEGHGAILLYTTPNPAPGFGTFVVAPAGIRWRVLNFACQLVTSAAVMSRIIYLEINISGSIVGLFSQPASCIASRTYTLAWVTGAEGVTGTNQAQTTSYITSSLGPDVWLRGGDYLNLGAYDFQGGDQFTSIAYVVEEWLDLN